MELKNLKCVDGFTQIKEYVEFYQLLRNSMEQPEWLGNFNEEKVNFFLSLGSKIWLYYDNDIPVCSFMYIPASNDALELFGIEEDEKYVGECGPIMVSDKYRGMGLQKQMLKVLEDYCKSINQTKVLTTIHPDNKYCINNFLLQDYKFMGLFNFKRGDRALYVKDLD